MKPKRPVAGRPTGTGPPALMMADRRTEHDHTKGDKMAKFHVTIKNNETGEFVVDCESSCIIGAFEDTDDGGVNTTVAISCSGIVLAHTTSCVANAVQRVQDDHPEIAAFLAFRAAMEKEGGAE